MFSHSWAGGAGVPGLGASQQRTHRPRRQVALAAAVAVGIGGGVFIATRPPALVKVCDARVQPVAKKAAPPRVRLPVWLAQFVAGSFAECVQALVLYPLDTLKVNCQHTGMGSIQTFQWLLRTYPGPNLVRVLYNGAGTMALASIFIGSVYYVAFKQSTVFFEGVFARGAKQPAGGAARLPGDSAPERGAPPAETSGSSHGDARADVCAAVVSSVCAGVIEGPIECVRNRVQAGVVREGMMHYIFHGGGVAAAWPFFVPHLLKSLPYDVAELVTYSAISKYVESRNLQGPFSVEMRDALIGGIAGAAAVFASAPADCIKTRIVTMSPLMTESMTAGQLWRAASRHIMRTQGIAGMFVGTIPRLVEKVPSTMMYWVAIEACARFLKPYTEDRDHEERVAPKDARTD